jgi:hypothetical protein
VTTTAVRDWEVLADDQTIDETARALEANGFKVVVVKSADEAKRVVLDLVPEGAEVFAARSATLTNTGIADAIDESGRYESIRKKLMALNRDSQAAEMRSISIAPAFVVGSVHAVTQQGHVIVASFGGSQLPAYIYGANKVIWVVGTQKLVKNLEEGLRRIEEHSLPLESERLQRTYGIPSAIGKIAIFRKEVVPDRITIVLVREKLGF